MDICEKLSRTIDPNDPQFEALLKIAMQTEIAELEEELRVKRNRNQRKREELASVLERRKYLKKSIGEKTKLVESMRRATCCLQDYSTLMLEKVESTKKMLDEDSLKNLRIIEETEKLRDKYQKLWQEYEEQFESLPLAKERKLTKEELKRVEVQIGFINMNIQDMERNVRDYENFKELKIKKDIIKIAQIWLTHRNNVNNLKKLRQEDAELKAKIAEQEIKITALIKEKEDEERQKALARFQMPPPIMDQSFMETIMSQYSQQTPNVGQKPHLPQLCPSTDKDDDDNFDSASMSSSLFEMCITEKQSFVNEQRIEQVYNDPDNVSLSSNRDREFSAENKQSNTAIHSVENNLGEGIRSSTKNVVGSFQDPIHKAQIEKPALEKSEASKRPANSPEENKIRKKAYDEQSKTNIIEKSLQDNSALGLETMKTIQKNVRKQSTRKIATEKRVEVTSAISERMETAVVNSSIENFNLESSFSPLMNHSFAGSADSFMLNENNNNEEGTAFDINSDISMQSNLDDLNKSIIFSDDEISNVRSDNNFNDINAVNADPPAQAQMGIFSAQNNRFFNFQGFFNK